MTIATDGACSGNPGPGGWGYVAYVNQVEVRKKYGSDVATTNNRMELQAVINGLKYAVLAKLTDLDSVYDLTVLSDSSYVVNSITAGWLEAWTANGYVKKDKSKVKNSDLFKQLHFVLSLARICCKEVTFLHIKGHNGDIMNETADSLAVKGRNEATEKLESR